MGGRIVGYFNQGRGAVRQQRRAQLAALSFVFVFADTLGKPNKLSGVKFSNMGGTHLERIGVQLERLL